MGVSGSSEVTSSVTVVTRRRRDRTSNGRAGNPSIALSSSDAALFRRHYMELRRFAAATAASDIDPDDLVMAAVLRCLERGRLQAVEDPRNYLRRAVLNVLLNERRRLSRRNAALRRLGSRPDHEDWHRVEHTPLEALKPVDRALLYLVHVDGYSFREAAEVLDVSESIARTRASRARRRLRRELSEEAT
jgi:RNA polymerase sigma-70 factor, ECF subfamily